MYLRWQEVTQAPEVVELEGAPYKNWTNLLYVSLCYVLCAPIHYCF